MNAPFVNTTNSFQVRATTDNIKEILAALKAVKCENVANFTAGFEYAFELLHRVCQVKCNRVKHFIYISLQ